MNDITQNDSYINEPVEKLPKQIQGLLNLFAFFLAFPAINILGVSITFYIFFILAFLQWRAGIRLIIKNHLNKWFVFLFILGSVSTLIHPVLFREVSLLKDIQTVFQFLYWIILAQYVCSNYKRIDWFSISKWLLIGLIVSIIGFYIYPVEVNTFLFDFTSQLSRNSFIFNFLCFLPLSFWYIIESKVKRYRFILMFLFLLAIFFTNGRSGFILIIVQIIFIGMIIFPAKQRFFKLLMIGFVGLFIVWQASEDSKFLTGLARTIDNINPRTAELIKKEGSEGNLAIDKSWLVRKLMVSKSIEIVKEHPLWGIGWLHFSRYKAPLKELSNYPRLAGFGPDHYNALSSHNSYAQYLAEGGIFGFGILMYVFLTILIFFLKKLLFQQLDFYDLPLIAFFVMALYFYSIAVITGAGTWFIIGGALGSINYQKTNPAVS
jgi:O-antigen ligase